MYEPVSIYQMFLYQNDRVIFSSVDKTRCWCKQQLKKNFDKIKIFAVKRDVSEEKNRL